MLYFDLSVCWWCHCNCNRQNKWNLHRYKVLLLVFWVCMFESKVHDPYILERILHCWSPVFLATAPQSIINECCTCSYVRSQLQAHLDQDACEPYWLKLTELDVTTLTSSVFLASINNNKSTDFIGACLICWYLSHCVLEWWKIVVNQNNQQGKEILSFDGLGQSCHIYFMYPSNWP